MLPWIGRSLIVLLTLGATALIQLNMRSGLIAFALTTPLVIILSEINDGLITLTILTLLIGNVISGSLLGIEPILPWSNVAIIIVTAVLVELLLSTSQHTAFGDFFTLIGTLIVIILGPYFLISLSTLPSEKASLISIQVQKEFSEWLSPWTWNNVLESSVATDSQSVKLPSKSNITTSTIIKPKAQTPIQDVAQILISPMPYCHVLVFNSAKEDSPSYTSFLNEMVELPVQNLDMNVPKFIQPQSKPQRVTQPIALSEARNRSSTIETMPGRKNYAVISIQSSSNKSGGSKELLPVVGEKLAVIQPKLHANSLLIKAKEEKPATIQMQQGTQQRALSILAMVAIYLIIF